MERIDYQERLHEALTKAFAAKAADVRAAYFDLASFYHRKLGAKAHLHASVETLKSCLETKKAA